MQYKEFNKEFSKEIKKRGYVKREGHWVKSINDYYYLIDYYCSRFENLLLMSYCICFPFVDVEGKDEKYYRDLVLEDYDIKLDYESDEIIENLIVSLGDFEACNDNITKIINKVKTNKKLFSGVNTRFLNFLGYEEYKNWRGKWKWKKTSDGEYLEYLKRKQGGQNNKK